VKPGAAWPWIIGGALALHVVVSLVVVFIATSDPSYAVEEDYYQKALAWDEKRAQDHTNEVLGWSFEFAVTPPERPGDLPEVEAAIRDADGAPLNGATVSIEAFHNSRSDDILRTNLAAAAEPGLYRTTLPMRHNGRWEMRFVVERAGERFTYSESRHLFVEASQ
jgi:hypothetical protein